MKEVKSPCIAVCRVKNGLCIGCFRSVVEITEWYDATIERKLEILEAVQQRKNQHKNTELFG